jgi:hypothetical protein
MATPSTFGLLPHVHPRAAGDARYVAHRPDWGPWPSALPTAGPGEVGFGPVAGGFYPGGGNQPPFSSGWKGRSFGVGINPATADAMAARWADPEAAEAEFQAALYGDDPVALDLVFMRGHAMNRWDLLPAWYAKTWLVRGSVRSFAPPTGKAAAPLVLGPAPSPNPNQPQVYLLTGWDEDGAPTFATAPATWKPANGLAGTSPAAFTWPPSYWADPLHEVLRAWKLAPPARDVARGDGWDTLPAVSPTDAHASAWAWYWGRSAVLATPPPGYGLTSKYRGPHNWATLWKVQANSVEGLKWVPEKQSFTTTPAQWLAKSAWAGPFPAGLVSLAAAADAMRTSAEWQERASTWWQGYLTHCPAFGMPHTAGYLPPLWGAPSVSYRPHWWVVDADFLRERLDVAAPLLQSSVGPVADWDFHAETFRAAIAEWIAQDAHVVDPYGWWGHIACENWADQDIGDLLEVILPVAFVAVFAPAVATLLVGAFGLAGTTLAAALADIGGGVLGAGLQAEASGGTFAEGLDEFLDDPEDIVLDLVGAGIADEFGLDPDAVADAIDDPLGALADIGTELGADLLDDLLDVEPGTIGAALDAADTLTSDPMSFFDDILPDDFDEALEYGQTALEVAEVVDDFLDFFDDDPSTGGLGGLLGGVGGLGDNFGFGDDDDPLPPDFGPSDTALDLAPAVKGGSDFVPILAIGLLLIVVAKAA